MIIKIETPEESRRIAAALRDYLVAALAASGHLEPHPSDHWHYVAQRKLRDALNDYAKQL